MVITTNQLESLTSKNHTLTESLNAGINEIDSLKNSMVEYVNSQFEPIKTDFAHSIANSDSILSDSIRAINTALESFQFNVDQYFSEIEASVGGIWDEFEEIADSINANAVGIAANSESIVQIDSDLSSLYSETTGNFQKVDISVSNLNLYDSI